MKKKIANWNNFPLVESFVKTFLFEDDLKDYVRKTDRFIARGNGRCYGDASLADSIISTQKYNRILAFDSTSGVFTCQSGVLLDKILEVIIPQGWFLPVTPGTKFITVGGAVASDVHGKNHHIEGSFCKYVIAMEIMLPDGRTITCGRDRYEDLFEASCGGMGLTGVILTVSFLLKRVESSFMLQKKVKTANLDEMLQLFEIYKEHPYSVAWIDCLKQGKGFGRGVLFLGQHAKVCDLPPSKSQRPFEFKKRKNVTFPFYLPSWMLNKYLIWIFNYLFYHLQVKKNEEKIVTYDSFFYPLDVVRHWNKGYGKKGFVQYQFVLPFESYEGLVEILALISKKKMGSFLSVLKIFGHQEGLMSFPMKGFTFALDFPCRKGVFSFLEELDQIVLKYGGRLYLSKDARMSADVFKAGYPEYENFISILNKYNPGRKISSFQAERILSQA